MPGISEIFLLICLLCIILIISRIIKPSPSSSSFNPTKFYVSLKAMTANKRAGVVISFAYPAIFALILKPWEKDMILFLGFGIIPVFLFWSISWILAGRKK